MVWVTVTDTEGSTYSKPGEQMLIGPGEQFQGLLSGGCLEGDLLEHARQVRDSGSPRRKFYDMRDVVADELWGLGLGCDGALSIFMQRLEPEHGYEPFASLAQWAWEGKEGGIAIVVDSAHEQAPAGGSVRCSGGRAWARGLGGGAADLLERALEGLDKPSLVKLDVDGVPIEAFLAPVRPVPRLLLIGAGPDASPLATMAGMLGWRVSVVDYRQAALKRLEARPEQSLCLEAEQLASALALDEFHAAVLMTHNQARDREYLRVLGTTRIPYVGLLGPASRRDRLLAEIGAAGQGLAGRLYGPVGLDLGGRGPEAIALSIVAQVQAAMAGRCLPDQRGLAG
jgi:xanthine/CO dehydrogenase XdhC/CoxF family maturation factor